MLERAARGDISFELALIFTLVQIPIALELIIPLGLTLSALLFLGRMKNDSELVVMQASGYTLQALFRMFLIPVGLVAVLVAIISFLVTPAANTTKESHKRLERELTVFDTVQPRRFQSDRAGRLIYAESKDVTNRVLSDVFITQEDDGATLFILAETAMQEIRQDDKFLVLNEGTQYLISEDEPNWEITEFDQYLIRLEEQSSLRAEPLSGLGLVSLIHMNSAASWSIISWRISMPLVCLIMLPLVFLAIGEHSRTSRFVWLVPLVLIQFAYVTGLSLVKRKIEMGQIDVLSGMIGAHGVMIILIVTVYVIKRILTARVIAK